MTLPKDKLAKIRKHATTVANDLDKLLCTNATTPDQYIRLNEARDKIIEAVNAMVLAMGGTDV